MSSYYEQRSLVAYIGNISFPWGQAASRRVYGNAMSIVNSGRHVVVASGSDKPHEICCLETSDSGGRLFHIGLGGRTRQKQAQWQKALKMLFLSSLRTVQWLDSQAIKPSHLILYGGYTPYMLRLLPWCRRNNVALVADIVEWHSPSQHPGGIFGLSNLNISIAMRYLYPKCDGIISISSYLSDYYRRRGCRVVQIPPTIDISKFSATELVRPSFSNNLSLVYAGNPGKKDLLQPIIEGIERIDPDGKRVKLTVLGPAAKEVRFLYNNGRPLPESITVLGQIPQDEVAKVLRHSDFSVLLRPQMRFANAGFPTKFVESLANGVPVIANLTSDLGTYLRDGYNGFVCRDHNAEAFAEALDRALSLSGEERLNMRMAAHSKALQSFDYRLYSETLSAFLDKVHL